MAIKILGGSLKGAFLQVNELKTRPTGVLLKRKIFDARQRFDGIHFVDLCAGSGGIGFEALSRGASALDLVESDFHANKLLISTLKELQNKYINNKSLDDVRIHYMSCLKYVEHILPQGKSSEQMILFFDPPYAETNLYLQTMEKIKANNFKGEIWIEYDEKSDKKLLDEINNLYQLSGIKKYTHGQHSIIIVQF